MDDVAEDEDIARIEARIEALDEAIERCRKLALAAVIGGVVLLGSNSTTWEQNEAARAASAKLRAELIEGLQLRLVEERPTLH